MGFWSSFLGLGDLQALDLTLGANGQIVWTMILGIRRLHGALEDLSVLVCRHNVVSMPANENHSWFAYFVAKIRPEGRGNLGHLGNLDPTYYLPLGGGAGNLGN